MRAPLSPGGGGGMGEDYEEDIGDNEMEEEFTGDWDLDDP